MRKLTKAMAVLATSGALTTAFALPASAAVDTNTTVQGVTNAVGSVTGVCVTYTAPITLVRVNDPLHPGVGLVFVNAPVPTGARAC